MKICFPVSENKGLESTVYNHFGSAPMLMLVDGKKQSIIDVINREGNRRHGACLPLKDLADNSLDAVVVNGIGAGALSGLSQAGYKVYQASEGTVAANLDKILKNKLPELTKKEACSGHHRHQCGKNHDKAGFEFGCGF